MNFQRQCMRARVSRKFARVPGQHGDMAPPPFWPMPISPGLWGGPWAKTQDTCHQALVAMLVVIPGAIYYAYTGILQYHQRIVTVGRRGHWMQRLNCWMDMDDPDFEIKIREVEREIEQGKTDVHWGGANYIASYLWEPGDPEPDLRRRVPPEHH